MSITSLNRSTTLSPLSGLSEPQRPVRPPGSGAIAAAAKALGLSTDDVISQLRQGKSLADLAESQGVSRDDLAAALKADAPSQLRGSADVDSVISSIIDRTGIIDQTGLPSGPGGPRGPQGPPPAGPPPGTSSGVFGSSLTSDQQSMLDSLSSLLSTDPTTLLDELKSGTSLSDLLSKQNLSTDSLAGVLQNGLLFDARA